MNRENHPYEVCEVIALPVSIAYSLIPVECILYKYYTIVYNILCADSKWEWKVPPVDQWNSSTNWSETSNVYKIVHFKASYKLI